MRTFKHKYSSVEARQTEFGAYHLYINEKQIGVANPDRIEKDPENWVEVIEKDYEILQYGHWLGHKEKEILKVKRLPDGELFTVGDNYRGYVIEGFQELDNILWVHFNNASYPISTIDKFPKPKKDYEILEYYQTDGTEIREVKRLPDGVIFSIGDKDESGAVITNFTEKDGEINVGFDGYYRKLKDLGTRKPILKTEDGVEMFEGDKHYWVHDDMRIGDDLTDKGDPVKGYKYFSTRDVAEEYRLNYARILSLNDIADMVVRLGLRELVKSRLS